MPMLPPASEVVVTFSGGALTAMLRLAVVVAFVGVCESVRVTVKVEVPVNVPVGVPKITPALLKLKPAGKLPAVLLHLYDGTPPLPCSVWLYAVPIVPAGKGAGVMVNAGGGFTVTVIAWLADMPVASATWKVTEPLLAPVGVPVIAPVLAFKLNPAGNDPAVTLHVEGLVPPDSLNVAL